MKQNEVSKSYQEAAIRGANSLECTILLYDVAIEALRRAIEHLHGGDIESRSRELVRCLEALEALQNGLEMKTGGETAKRLHGFYSLARSKALEAQIQCKASLFGEILESMMRMREQWAQLRQESVAQRPEPVWAVAEHEEQRSAWSA